MNRPGKTMSLATLNDSAQLLETLLSDRILILSPQPGRVIAEFRVPFSRPREAGLTLSEELLLLKRHISAALALRTDHMHAVTT